MPAVMRRGSRKKLDTSSSREDKTAPPTASGGARRQQPPQEILQQQRKKHQDEVASLTTKNYRLAKELADLRLKHRDECKHVTRLTMENMNLASRCREAISHVAMLKKELAMQQKRTASALASQREQTKRMADSLTNSFISFSSPKSVEPKNQSSVNTSHRSSVDNDEDDNVMRLVSNTPSPNRDGSHQRVGNKNFDRKNGVKTSTSTLSASTRSTVPTSSKEESRDSPASTATTSSTSDLGENDKLVDRVALSASKLSPEKEKNGLSKGKKKDNVHVVYSTPKKSERTKSCPFPVESDQEFDNTTDEKLELFPISASPKVYKKSNSNLENKTYDEGFPSDTIDQPGSMDDAKSKGKINLMNSIDAFEQSFSTDFPDSFTPKESNSDKTLSPSGSGQKIYNPFFSTPEKLNSPADSSFFGTPEEEKASSGSSSKSQIEYETPPKRAASPSSPFDESDADTGPKRPEKSIPSAARARYEKALGPRVESSSLSKQSSGKAFDKGSSSGGSSPGALFRRIQQKKRLDKNLESISNGSTPESQLTESPSSERKHQSQKAVLNIVDTFEQSGSGKTEVTKDQNSSTASRFHGPIKSLRRRSVNRPISYAEPALNTKLRRGDTYFPKASPAMTSDDDENRRDDQNEVPNLVKHTPVVSP